MRRNRLLLNTLLLLSLLALSGCAMNPPQYVAVKCPSLPPVPASLMLPPPVPLHSASLIQSLLFEPVMKPTNANTSSISK